MKPKIILAIIILLSIAFQDACCPYLAISGIIPNIPLILAVFAALLKGEKYGIVCGCIVGLLMDLNAGKYLGLNMLSLMLVALVVARTMTGLYRANYIIPLSATAIGSLVYYISFLLLSNLIGTGVAFWENLVSFSLAATLYNTFIALLLYVIIYIIFEKIMKRNIFD